jgi:hypothetical protein
MSATLYVLVVLQGTTLSFSPGYTTAAECMQQYKGPNVACFNYDPEGTSWTAFFKLPDGAFRVVRRIPNEGECQRYIGAFKSDVPTACRQLAMPTTCSAACRPAEPPSPQPPPAAKPDPDPKPDPASIDTKPNDIQVDGKQYTRVAGLAGVEKEDGKAVEPFGRSPETKQNSFADVSVGPTKLQAKDFPTPLPPKVQKAVAQRRGTTQQYRSAPSDAMLDGPNPFSMIAGLITGYPARRD